MIDLLFLVLLVFVVGGLTPFFVFPKESLVRFKVLVDEWDAR